MSGASFDVFKCSLDGRSLIEASAGTGKTWNICWLYLRLLLERRLKVENILVVTFTNAATAELRERIRARARETLAWLKGDGSPDPHIESLINALKDRGLELDDIQARLDAALQSFDQAAIFTIHSFCQRALGGSAFSAGQAFALELVPNDSDLLREVVHDFWRRHVASGDISPELAAMLLGRNFSPDDLLPLLKHALAKPLAKIRWPDDIGRPPAIDRESLKRLYVEARELWQQERQAIVGDVLKAAQDKHLKNNSYNEGKIVGGADDLDRYFQAGDAWADAGGNAELFSADFMLDRKSKNGTLPSHRFFGLLAELFELRWQAERELELARLGLLKRLIEQADAVRRRKRERRLLSHDDTLYNLYAALTGGDKPWLAPSLRQQYPAALIDEFQDTDALQYTIFDTIYGGSPDSHSVFFVGDPKQAIYKFRNADLNVYFKAQDRIRERHTLKENQRSSGGLIDALNALFQSNSRAFMQDGLDYVPVSLGRKPRQPFHAPAESTASLRIWTLPRDEAGIPVTRAEAMRAAAESTADEIARLLNSASRNEITIGERPLAASNIAVLVRKRKEGHLVRQALLARGVGSVELSQQSVFHSAEAEDLERVLGAILSPRESRLRAALATGLIGLDADAVHALRDDQQKLAAWIERFAQYREIWLRHGIGAMLRHLQAQEDVSARMLRHADGERRLTNLLHLVELLHQAAETQNSPEALLRWLATTRRDEAADDETQLRLESDRKLVKIVTIHKSKGLEYEIVFCPFLWDGYRGPIRHKIGPEYHDDEGNLVIDMRMLAKEEKASVAAAAQSEEAAEALRLVYVALTRAVHRCYLIAGCYRKNTRNGGFSTAESARSLLNWLAAGGDDEPGGWGRKELAPNEIATAWESVRAKCPESIELLPLPAERAAPVMLVEEPPELQPAATPPTHIPPGWRIGSFSNLLLGAKSEIAAADHDGRVPAPERAAEPEEEMRPDDILLFPRGARAGDCIHAAFEQCDFTDPSGWEQAVESALLLHPQQVGSLGNIPESERAARLKAMMLRMMGDVLNTPLQDGVVLGQVGLERRLTEMEFFLPAPDLSPDALHDLLQTLGYAIPSLNAARLRGYLKGYIDLVFEHDGRYYILDWKSNHLGNGAAGYRRPSMEPEMAAHGYHLQYLLYAVALNRYLAQRVPGYDYETHFGGVLYLFVRGVRRDWKDVNGNPCGTYFHRPARSVIDALDAALRGSPEAKTTAASQAESLTA